MEVIPFMLPLVIIGYGFYALPFLTMLGLLAVYLIGVAVTYGITCTLGERDPKTQGDSFTGDFTLDFITMAFWPISIPLIIASKLGRWMVTPSPLPDASDPEDEATARYLAGGHRGTQEVPPHPPKGWGNPRMASGMSSHARYERPRSQPITASENDGPTTPHKPKR